MLYLCSISFAIYVYLLVAITFLYYNCLVGSPFSSPRTVLTRCASPWITLNLEFLVLHRRCTKIEHHRGYATLISSEASRTQHLKKIRIHLLSRISNDEVKQQNKTSMFVLTPPNVAPHPIYIYTQALQSNKYS